MSTSEDTENKSDSGGKKSERVSIATAMRSAAAQLTELLQREAVSVSSVKATDEGWMADVEVVEIEKIPDTMSVMATYHVSLDGQGQLIGYERVRRYARGQVDR
ncbi:gas vesicle protein [Streptomyces sp. NPDC049954]|uniref:gas vesicle protein GvpO n=1 Tax=Streptomyces sp. NPDC049954 TaxID=3155779 RepID=UPI003432375E